MSTENEVEIEYDVHGFDADGTHRDTGTEFNPEGYDRYGYDEDGFNSAGYNEHGYDADGYDEDGWDADNLHRDTDTEFGPNCRTRDGSRYDSDGYDYEGYDRDGYDRDGYGTDGYNEDGEDQYGNTRCENGDCDDDYCECRRNGSDNLLCYSTCVLRETDWLAHRYKPNAPTVAFEFECVSHNDANDAMESLLDAWNPAYKSLVGATRTGKGAICKEDGSLPENTGLEFVTVPMLLDQHRAVLRAAFSTKFGDGAVSAWNHTKCGMHVHLARASLSNLTLGKMLCFMHSPHNVPFHVAIAGRHSSYAAFHPHRSDVSNGLPTKAAMSEKYSALNVKKSTVEFRIFRPSCRFETLLKNLCYVLAVRDFCRQSSASKFALGWEQFLSWLGTTDARLTYRELDAWLRASDSDYGSHYRATAKPMPKPKPAA